MRNTSLLKFKPASPTDNSLDSEAGPAPSKLATSLTLAAMSLGYGVVQLDVTIVNTALNAIGTSLGGGVAELQWVVSAYTITFAAFSATGCLATLCIETATSYWAICPQLIERSWPACTHRWPLQPAFC